jgi:hypothetical protein
MKSKAETEFQRVCDEKGLCLRLVVGLTMGRRKVYTITRIGSSDLLEAGTLKHLAAFLNTYH